MNSPLTAFAGHRSLDKAFFPLVLDAVQAALERDSGLVVGCCTGRSPGFAPLRILST